MRNPELLPHHARVIVRIGTGLGWFTLLLVIVGLVVYGIAREGRIWGMW